MSSSASQIEGTGRGLRWFAWSQTALFTIVLGAPFLATAWKSLRQLDASIPDTFGTFIGLANYHALLTTEPDLLPSLAATARFIAIALAQCLPAAALAVWLRRLWPLALPPTMVVLLASPLLVSPTVLGLLGRLYLHDEVGIVSLALRRIGWLAADQAPLATSRGVWWSLATLDAWQWVPFTALLIWASWRLVPASHVEAARIDGLSIWRRWLWVELPQIATPIAAILLVRCLEAFRTFDLPQVLTGGGPGTRTLVVSLYANRLTFNQQRFGVGAAHLVLIETAAYAAILLLLGRLQALRAWLRSRAV